MQQKKALERKEKDELLNKKLDLVIAAVRQNRTDTSKVEVQVRAAAGSTGAGGGRAGGALARMNAACHQSAWLVQHTLEHWPPPPAAVGCGGGGTSSQAVGWLWRPGRRGCAARAAPRAAWLVAHLAMHGGPD